MDPFPIQTASGDRIASLKKGVFAAQKASVLTVCSRKIFNVTMKAWIVGRLRRFN